MAQKRITLELTILEERALARLIGFMCKTEVDENMTGELSRILGKNNPDVEQIGCINAVLNSVR